MSTVESSMCTVTSQGHRTRRKPCRKGTVAMQPSFASRIRTTARGLGVEISYNRSYLRK